MNSYILIATQSTNLGDLVINKMLIEELCRHGTVFVDILGLPSEFSKYLLENNRSIDVYNSYFLSVKRLNLYRLYKLYKLIESEKIKIYTHSPGPLYDLSFYRRWAFTFLNYFFKSRRVSVLNIGSCASTSIIKKQKIHKLGADYFFLRSQASVDYVNSFFPDISSFIPDMAFLLKFHIKRTTGKAKRVAISFRPEAHNFILFRQRCLETIRAFAENGYEVILYHQVKCDQEFMTDLYKQTQNSLVHLRERIVWFQDLDFYQDKVFIVSNRLHALLIGAVYGAIPIVLTNNQDVCAKISHVFNTSFKDSAALFMNDGEKPVDINRYIKNRQIYTKLVEKIVSENAALCRKTIEMLQ